MDIAPQEQVSPISRPVFRLLAAEDFAAMSVFVSLAFDPRNDRIPRAIIAQMAFDYAQWTGRPTCPEISS